MEGIACVGVLCYMIFGLGAFVFSIWCYWKYAEKMGFEPVKCLFLLIPFYNIYIMYWLAANDWPVHEELKRARGETPPPPE